MTMIPNTSNLVAVFSRTVGDGRQCRFNKQIVAWSDGAPLVAGKRSLVAAADEAGFVGLYLADAPEPPVVASLPATGWRYRVKDDDGQLRTLPVTALNVHVDGSVEAVELGGDGLSEPVAGFSNFVALLAPGRDDDDSDSMVGVR